MVGVIVVIAFTLLGGGGGGFDIPAGVRPGDAGADRRADAGGPGPGRGPASDFSTYVFNDVQGTWERTFEAAGRPYERAKLVFYSGAREHGVRLGDLGRRPVLLPRATSTSTSTSPSTATWSASSAPRGDFAWAYVIAHEVGHHVQQQLGTSGEVEQIRRSDPDRANDASVRLELQADCYAGVWASTVFDAARAGRPRRGAHRLRGGRRRPDAVARRPPGEPGHVHARLVRAAARLVRARPRARRARPTATRSRRTTWSPTAI